jgi:hypothetical protein
MAAIESRFARTLSKPAAGHCGLCLEAETSSEIRPPNNNFYFDQTFLIKGVAFALVWRSRQIKEQLECVKGQVQKNARIFERGLNCFLISKKGGWGCPARALLCSKRQERTRCT